MFYWTNIVQIFVTFWNINVQILNKSARNAKLNHVAIPFLIRTVKIFVDLNISFQHCEEVWHICESAPPSPPPPFCQRWTAGNNIECRKGIFSIFQRHFFWDIIFIFCLLLIRTFRYTEVFYSGHVRETNKPLMMFDNFLPTLEPPSSQKLADQFIFIDTKLITDYRSW